MTAARPETRYAKSEDVHIAYQVSGAGPLDLVFVPGFVSHLEGQWENPGSERLLKGFGSFSRLIKFDKRGTGLSDHDVVPPTLEQRMDDVRAVMDATGSAQAALFGVSEGGPMSCLFAATYPERVKALILYASFARIAWAADYPWGQTAEQAAQSLEGIEDWWGTPAFVAAMAPSAVNDAEYLNWGSRYYRLAASPGGAKAIMKLNREIDVRPVLPVIRVPTLLLHRTGDKFIPVERSRHLARHIAGAKLVELPGIDHPPWYGDVDAVVGEVQEFLTGARVPAPEADRVLATVLFTDVVGSTERAIALGDHGWRTLLGSFYALARRELARYRGREIDTAGDGLFATFDGPARAIRCASAISEGVRSLGIEVRTGVHTGECEVMGDKISGIAVHTGARVAAQAAPSEVLVSGTVKDLVAGSGLQFEDRGTRPLKGLPGEWRLFAVTGI